MNTALPQEPARHRARLFRRARRRRRDPARRVGQAALHLARARREPRAPLRSGDARRLADAADRAPARPRLPVVPGARGLPRHPRPDRAGRPRRPARRHRRAGRRSGPGQSGGADAADRRPLAGGGVRRLRSGRVREEPRDRGSPQRGPLPLHRLDQDGVQERRRDPAGQRDHAPDQPGADVAGGPRARTASRSRIRWSAPTATRRTSTRWA